MVPLEGLTVKAAGSGVDPANNRYASGTPVPCVAGIEMLLPLVNTLEAG